MNIHVIDSHTGGEPTRVVVSGVPDLGRGPLSRSREVFRARFDRYRSAIVNEPRGSDAMVGALLCESDEPGCASGVIFFNNIGYLGMCGHGAIGVIATLAHLGKIRPGFHRMETPVGIVSAELHESGEVTIGNVESYRLLNNVIVNVEGFGVVCGDVAWGGNWFFLVAECPIVIDLAHIEALTDFTWRVRQALSRDKITGANGAEIDHIEVFGPASRPDVNSRNFVLCPGKAYDRSPCGTGTSAKLACRYADGKLREGDIWRQESIAGSVFEGCIRVRDGHVYPFIKGMAHINAEADLVLAEADPVLLGNPAMSEPLYDVVIAGAGIVGAACAYECSREGLKVAVLERDFVGAGTTAAGMGHVVVMDDSEAQFALTRYSQQLWQELASELPADCEYVRTGTLWVAADEDEMNEVRRKHQFYSQRKVPSEILDARSLDAAEPQLRTGLAGALFVKEDAVVYPACVARYLLERARDLGARVLLGRQVIRLDDEGAAFDDGTVMKGAVMVNAAGARAASLHPDLPIVPRKGHLLITERYPGFVRHQLIELGYLKSAHKSTADSVAFNIQPRKTGQLLIGSSRQYGVDSPEIDRSILSRMLARAAQYIPSLTGLSALRAWTGLRAATPDNLPLIGRCPGYRYVFAATGHEGLGITTSLATARLLIDQLMSRSPAISSEPYSVQRNTTVHG